VEFYCRIASMRTRRSRQGLTHAMSRLPSRKQTEHVSRVILKC